MEATEKKIRGRGKLYGEETMVMSIRIPKSQHQRLKTIIEYELSKLQTKK